MSPEGKFTKTKTKDIPISPTKSEEDKEDKEEVTSFPDKDKDNNMSKSDTWIPKSPTMGGLILVGKDDYMAWTGGKPNVEWTSLVVKNTRNVSAPQYRPIGHKSIQPHIHRVRGLKNKFERSSELEVFVTNVAEHLKKNGLDTIAYLRDPADKTKMLSVVEHHGRFTLPYTIAESDRVVYQWDEYDRNNDDEAIQFLWDLLQADFKKSIQQLMKDDSTFAKVWITIMRKCNQNSLEYFRRMESNIKKCSPLTFEGQNIDLWATAVRTNVNLLINSGQYDHKLSEDIVNQALKAGGDNNEDWKSVIRPIKRELQRKLEEIGLFQDKKQMNTAMAEANLAPEDILSKIEAEYNSLINTEE